MTALKFVPVALRTVLCLLLTAQFQLLAAPNTVVHASLVLLIRSAQTLPLAALQVALGVAPIALTVALTRPCSRVSTSWTPNVEPMLALVTMPGSPSQAIAASEARLITSLPLRHLESADPGPVDYAPATTSCPLSSLHRR